MRMCVFLCVHLCMCDCMYVFVYAQHLKPLKPSGINLAARETDKKQLLVHLRTCVCKNTELRDFIRDSLSLKRKADIKNVATAVKLLMNTFQPCFLPSTPRDTAVPV